MDESPFYSATVTKGSAAGGSKKPILRILIQTDIKLLGFGQGVIGALHSSGVVPYDPTINLGMDDVVSIDSVRWNDTPKIPDVDVSGVKLWIIERFVP